MAARKKEIESLIGMDAIHEYRERKAIKEQIDALGEEAKLARDTFNSLRTVAGASLAMGAFSLLFSLLA